MSTIDLQPSPGEDWPRLSAGPNHCATVDVIIPVYTGFEHTLACLRSVMAARQRTPFNVVIIDDHGPDESLRQKLYHLAPMCGFEIHSTPSNEGFVRACNLGFTLHPERDILILNSDTQVYSDWLDRLRAAAYREPMVATVTPFSNNAAICSYPKILVDNNEPLELEHSELDQLARAVNAGASVHLPTGLGCCMYITRRSLAAIGPFNSEVFGQGYGEEIDFCLRAANDGWSNLLAADVFITHHGGVSFGTTKSERVAAAYEKVKAIHPDCESRLASFMQADPARPWRAALDIARLGRRAESKGGALLLITHSWGGGPEKYAQELARIVEASGTPVFIGRADPERDGSLRIEDPETSNTPNLPVFDVRRDLGEFSAILKNLRIRHLHLNHLAGFPAEALDFFRVCSNLVDITYDVTVHDWMSFCPRIDVIDRSEVYCGEPNLDACEVCIGRDGSPFESPSVWMWREAHARLFKGARKIYVPDEDAQQRMQRHFPGLDFAVCPHPEVGYFPPERKPSSAL